jgi:cytochrome bd-type quinol oxidase subunit 2
MAGIIYSMCALTALLCAWLLLLAYRRNRYKLLLWSGLCFVGLTLNNVLLIVDKLVVPDYDLSVWRSASALLSLMILLYGLIWDAK